MQNLQSKLGYEFRDKKLLLLALTHRSTSVDNNERLEWLGDSVLEMAVTSLLFSREKGREGHLSKLRDTMVCNRQLAELASALNLESLLICFTTTTDNILADTLEAIIGAIYLDGGLEMTKRVVEKIYAPILSKPFVDNNFKSKLQEASMRKYGIDPEYNTWYDGVSFQSIVGVSSTLRVVSGRGITKREAEQAAARAALEIL